MNINTLLVLITALASSILAFIVIYKGYNRVSNLTLGLFSIALSVWLLAQGMGALFNDRGIVLLWTRVNMGAAVWIPILYLHFIISILDFNKKAKIGILFAYVIGAIFTCLDFTPLFVKDVVPTAEYAFYPQAGIVYPYFTIFLLFCFAIGFLLLFLKLLKPEPGQFQKLLYIFIASIIGVAGGLTTYFPMYGINFPVISHFALPVYVAISAYAIIRHKLIDLSIVIREGLVYSFLMISFAAIYALMILLAEKSLKNIPGFSEYWAMVVVVGVSVAIFQPLRNWIQSVVDRIFYRGAYYYQKTIDDLSSDNVKLFNSLVRADKLAAMGTLAAGMAHEIKNPLAAIKGMTQILPENLNDQEFIKDYTEMVPRQLDRINKIVENLLKAGKSNKPEKKEANINEIMEEVLDFHAGICKKQNIDVVKKLNKPPKLFVDLEQIHQVFTNIILNAIQAMPKGGRLEVKTLPIRGGAMVQISDNGIGISQDKINQIFDPFFSLKDTGTGLGLFTAYRIIQGHKGSIEVESALGKGATFKICLYTNPRE